MKGQAIVLQIGEKLLNSKIQIGKSYFGKISFVFKINFVSHAMEIFMEDINK